MGAGSASKVWSEQTGGEHLTPGELRKRMPIVKIDQTSESYCCNSLQSLLQGMTQLGRRGIPVGCLNGGCGVCKIKILEGEYRQGPMSRAHVSEDEQQQRIVLACRVYPCSDVVLSVVGKMAKSVIGAAAGSVTGTR